ncbi:YdcH family protein [Aliamphritea ceti]|uniref:YdcH family protein n=1 Tax=Aliamphritea ceti TaxID=1524258 RepID=UPI0021C3E075|nr:DUF465 domain-containing protein [Aliamphritea ceti]
MSIEHHDLIHELPEYRERIHTLKMSNAHFSRLFEEYHDVTKEVERMESLTEPVCSETESARKAKRLHLKDQLFSMLTAEPA